MLKGIKELSQSICVINSLFWLDSSELTLLGKVWSDRSVKVFLLSEIVNFSRTCNSGLDYFEYN